MNKGQPIGRVVYRFSGLREGKLVKREKRFLATVELENVEVLCHVHDPGRIPDLVPGSRVLIRETTGIKTKCSVTAFLTHNTWVVCDSRIHSEVASFFLPSDARKEVKVGRSRLDFMFDRTYVEVKGCTLVEAGIARFPDSPTERGKKHIHELISLKSEGYNAALLILVMRDDAKCFEPNTTVDPAFAAGFWEALRLGVEVKVLKFALQGNLLKHAGDVPLCSN